jgi:hypothetical protein
MVLGLVSIIALLIQTAAPLPCGCCPDDPPATVRQLESLGRLRGSVTYDGLELPGATITLIDPRGKRTAVTDANGEFDLPNVNPAGPVVVVAELAGMKTRRVRKVFVKAGEETRVSLRMNLSSSPADCIDCGNATPVRMDGPGFVVTREMMDRLPW